MLEPGDDRAESVQDLIDRAEELQGYDQAKQRREDRMDALTGEGGAPDDDDAAQEEPDAGQD